MGTRPRMSDLAASAGVSVSTVSRVLNGKPGIRENTRQAVLQAMADLGYDREKLQQRTGVVGVMVPELSNPSFPAFAERLDAMFQPVHRAVIAAAGPLGANESSCIATLVAGALCSGLVLGAFWALTAIYGRALNFSDIDIANFTAVAILGGALTHAVDRKSVV